MDSRLYIVFALTAIIHMINTFAYAVRLAGVRTKRLGIALSLFNVIFLISSTANTIQGPLLSKFIEKQFLNVTINSSAYTQGLSTIAGVIRIVLVSGTVGTILGTLLIPYYVRIFTKGIMIFEKVKSVPKLVILVLSPKKAKAILNDIEMPISPKVVDFKFSGIPSKLIILNIIITGIFTTGVLSAVYAGSLVPQFGKTATLLASIINGVAMVLLATLVDPTVGMVVDQAINQERSEEDVKKMVRVLAVSRIAGTILAQAIFLPAAYIIEYVAKVI